METTQTKTLDDLAVESHEIASSHGFYTPDALSQEEVIATMGDVVLAQLGERLLVPLCEVAEWARKGSALRMRAALDRLKENIGEVQLLLEDVSQRSFQGEPMMAKQDLVISKMMLVATECGEAIEAADNGDEDNFFEELTDINIRVYDLFGAAGVSPTEHYERKTEKNRNRPHRHGKLC